VVRNALRPLESFDGKFVYFGRFEDGGRAASLWRVASAEENRNW